MAPIHRCGASLALALAALSGCATQRTPPPQIEPAASAHALEARRLDDPRLLRFVAAARSLEEGKGEPGRAGSWGLDELSLAALYYHPDLDLARARLAAARADAALAARGPNPSAGLSLGYNATTAVPSPWTVGLMVDFILESFGRREARTAQAAHLADAARDDLESATWKVRAGVRDALLAMWAAGRRLALAQRQLGRRAELADLVERRFAAGAASALDVSRERIARDRARLELADAERLRSAARARLAQAVGVPLRALEGLKISLAAFDAPVPVAPEVSTGALRERALTRRADVRAMLDDYLAAQSALRLQVARRWPDLHLGPGYTYDQGDNKFSLELGAELPRPGRSEDRIASAEARRAEAAARFEALQARILGEIDAAAAGYRAAAGARAGARALAAQAERRVAGMRRAFDAGQVGRPALVAAGIELGAARRAALDARAAEDREVASLEDALQTPLFGSPRGLPLEERNPRLATENER